MQKEQAVLGFVAVAVLGFAVGRMTAPGGASAAGEGGAKVQATASATKIALPVGKAPTKGPASAKVTIIEVSDFQ